MPAHAGRQGQARHGGQAVAGKELEQAHGLFGVQRQAGAVFVAEMGVAALQLQPARQLAGHFQFPACAFGAVNGHVGLLAIGRGVVAIFDGQVVLAGAESGQAGVQAAVEPLPSQATPDFKGIKTPAPADIDLRARFRSPLISKGLRLLGHVNSSHAFSFQATS